MDIKLNFINNSNDVNNSRIVIFQKNLSSDGNDAAVAWKVIKNCGQTEHHPFTYSQQTRITSSDSWGNYTPMLDATPGTAFTAVMNEAGDGLRPTGKAASASEIELLNGLEQGSVGAHVYRSGRMVAVRTGIAPGQKAVFTFRPTIWIGAVSQVEEGDVMNPAITSAVNTEISLLGIASADIVMTGGGPGANSTAFQFNLQNIVLA